MSGDVTLFMYRQGDYTRILRFFERSWMWVAEVEDRIVGSISWSWHTVQVHGQPEKVGWLADARVHPDYRKSSLIYRLLRTAYQQGQEEGVDLTIGTTLEGNQTIEVLASGRAGFPSFSHIGTFDILQLLPGLPITQSPQEPEIRSATAADLPTICDLLNSCYHDYLFHPERTSERLSRIIDLGEGMRLEDYLLACRNGQVVAVVQTWDPQEFKKPIVVAYSPYLEVVTRITRLLNRFTSIPGMPVTGGSLRYLWLRDLACAPGAEGDLKKLIRHIYRQAKGSPYHFLMCSGQRNDWSKRLYHGLFRTRVTLNLWVCSLSGRDIYGDLAPPGQCIYHDNSLY